MADTNTANIDDNTLDLLNSSSESIQFNNPPEAISLYQTLYHDKDSILSCSTINDKIFVGCQSGVIKVWDNKTLLKLGTLLGHTSAVLCLTLSKDGQRLYSGSSDDTVRVWCTKSLQPLYIIHTRTNVGDILSIVNSPVDNTIYIGCQNTSIQKFNLEEYLQIQSPHIKKKLVPNPTLKGQTDESEGFDVADYFFNQCNIKGSTKLRLKDKIKDGEIQLDKDMSLDGIDPATSKVVPEFFIPSEWIYPHCHYGYIYSLTIGSIPEDPENEYLFSGSGDGDIKIWKICPSTNHLIEFTTLQNDKINNIYSLVIKEDYLICGSQGGNILIFDLDTFSKFRTLIGHKDDVLSLCLYRDELFSASADGAIKRWNSNLDVVENKAGHEGMILTLSVNDQGLLLSGGSDHMLKLWWVQPTRPNSVSLSFIASEDVDCIGQNNNSGFINLLNKFVSIPTISGNPKFQQDCMRGARFLKNLFLTLGAESKLVHGAQSRNPLVLAKFKSNKKKPGVSSAFNTPKTSSQSSNLNISSDSSKTTLESKTPHILFYGHYDVIPVDESQWTYHPFKVTGANGYLYGRGVTDNKGPILATIFAIAELYQAKDLDVDITLVIEGEEESGSIGFYEAVKKHKNWIGKPDLILLSNSYWIGEAIPCITYGLRGKINASIQVSNPRPDAHSGFYGGVIGEPLIDLTRVLSKLVTEDHKVNIPGFYDNVRPVSNREDSYYTNLADVIDINQSEAIKAKLQSQWRFPTLTLHRIVSSGPSDHSSVISSFCKADISMRIVPDQKLEDIIKQFVDHVIKLFSELKSDNKVNVEIHQTANWWIANPDNEYYDLLTDCITKEWGKSPLLIREGGSIPTVPWLEDFFKCPAIHFPMGQSTDQAHLKNERIRLRNLQAGKNIIRNFFIKLASKKSNNGSSEIERDKVFEPNQNEYSMSDNNRKSVSSIVFNNSLLNLDNESDADSLNQFKTSDIEDI